MVKVTKPNLKLFDVGDLIIISARSSSVDKISLGLIISNFENKLIRVKFLETKAILEFTEREALFYIKNKNWKIQKKRNK